MNAAKWTTARPTKPGRYVVQDIGGHFGTVGATVRRKGGRLFAKSDSWADGDWMPVEETQWEWRVKECRVVPVPPRKVKHGK